MKKRGLLIVNLGSPDSPSVKDVRIYLNQFLMDKEVIDLPYFFRLLLVRGLIVPFRAPKSAHAYSKIFTSRGSPLKFHTEDFTKVLTRELKENFERVEEAMRYGSPSIESRLLSLAKEGVENLVVAPMYPQFAKSSSRTVLGEVQRVIKKHRLSFSEVLTFKDFFWHPAYFQSFSQAIREEISSFRPDHLLLSYHGLPERHVKEFAPRACFQSAECCAQWSDKNRWCYRAQCFQSSRRIMEGLPGLDHTVSFQSRLGREEWIKPYTDQEIHLLLQKGVKRLLVACPAFVADCLETLEEIQLRLREDFLQAGGEDLKLVSSLNSRPFWVKAFGEMILQFEREGSFERLSV